MKLKHVFLFTLLLFLGLQSCQKDNDQSAPADIELSYEEQAELALKNLKTTQEKNFFDKTYILRTNPNIVEQLRERNETEDLTNDVYNFLLLKNQEYDFINSWSIQYGYPVWTQSRLAKSLESPSVKAVLIPFTTIAGSEITTFMIAVTLGWDNSEWHIEMVEKDTLLLHVQNDFPDENGAGYKIYHAVDFDLTLFDTEVELLSTWLTNNPPELIDEGFSGFGVEDRSALVTLYICPYIVLQDEEVMERSCNGYYYTFSASCAGGSSYNFGSGNSIGSNGGTGSNNNGGGGGSVNYGGGFPLYDHQIVAGFENNCFYYMNYEAFEYQELNPANIPNTGPYQADDNVCNAFEYLNTQTLLSDSQLA